MSDFRIADVDDFGRIGRLGLKMRKAQGEYDEIGGRLADCNSQG